MARDNLVLVKKVIQLQESWRSYILLLPSFLSLSSYCSCSYQVPIWCMRLVVNESICYDEVDGLLISKRGRHPILSSWNAKVDPRTVTCIGLSTYVATLLANVSTSEWKKYRFAFNVLLRNHSDSTLIINGRKF